MRKGHNPNRDQKKLLTKNKKNAEEWLVVKTVGKTFTFRHKETGELLELTLPY